MHRQNIVSRHLVTADVRFCDTGRPFERKNFDLMLGAHQDLTKKRLEAKRVLHQIGYDVRGVNVAEIAASTSHV